MRIQYYVIMGERDMKKGIKRYMMSCMAGRTDEIVNDMAANNNAFRKITDKIILISEIIENMLPPEYRKLFEELEDLKGNREVIIYKKLYWQALKDGIKISNIFHSLK